MPWRAMQLPDTQLVVINAISFQLVWWSGVLLGNQALVLSVSLLVAHFLLSGHRRADLRLMLILGSLGLVLDGLLMVTGFFLFADFPWWLALLWLHFSLTLNASLSFLKSLPLWVAGALGAVFGPLSYLAGAKFDAVVLPLGDWLTASVLGLIWALLMPFGVLLAKRSKVCQTHKPQAVLEEQR